MDRLYIVTMTETLTDLRGALSRVRDPKALTPEEAADLEALRKAAAHVANEAAGILGARLAR
jgi:hypothetical protein